MLCYYVIGSWLSHLGDALHQKHGQVDISVVYTTCMAAKLLVAGVNATETLWFLNLYYMRDIGATNPYGSDLGDGGLRGLDCYGLVNYSTKTGGTRHHSMHS